MKHRRNYDLMLFLASPVAIVWVQTYDFVFTKQTPYTIASP